MTVSTLARQHGYLEGAGALRLHYRTWELPEPLAAALVVHDLGEHGGRYAPLAGHLAGRGIVTVAPDLRGHGRSDGRRGHVSRFEVFLQDLDRFRCEAQGLTGPGSPLFLLGIGLGGLIVLRYLQEFGAPVSGAVLVDPWIGGAPLRPVAVSLARALGRVLPALRLRLGLGVARALGDPTAGPPHADEPLAHDSFTPRFYREATAAMDQLLQRRGRVAVPLLVLLGEGARGTDPERTTALLRSLDHPVLEVRRCAGRPLHPLGGPGAEPLLSAVVAWMENRIRLDTVETAVGAGTGFAFPRSAEHAIARP